MVAVLEIKTMKFFILFMLASVASFAQTNIKDVKVFAMDSKEVLNTVDTLGEDIVRLKRSPKTIENLSPKDLKMLQKSAIDNHANAVSIDLKRLWMTDNELHDKNEYYILYLKNK